MDLIYTYNQLGVDFTQVNCVITQVNYRSNLIFFFFYSIDLKL